MAILGSRSHKPSASAHPQRAKVRWVLRSLVEQHKLVSLRVNAKSRPLPSAVLAVHAESIEIDAVADDLVHAEIQPGTALEVLASNEGVPLHFVTVVRQVLAQGNFFAYEAALPDEIDYRERRSDFRARLSPGAKGLVLLSVDEHSPIRANLIDVSVSGLGVRLPLSMETRAPGAGACVAGIIQYADEPPVEVQLQIRHHSTRSANVHLGLEVIIESRLVRKRYQAIVGKAQRDYAQHKAESASA